MRRNNWKFYICFKLIFVGLVWFIFHFIFISCFLKKKNRKLRESLKWKSIKLTQPSLHLKSRCSLPVNPFHFVHPLTFFVSHFFFWKEKKNEKKKCLVYFPIFQSKLKIKSKLAFASRDLPGECRDEGFFLQRRSRNVLRYVNSSISLCRFPLFLDFSVLIPSPFFPLSKSWISSLYFEQLESLSLSSLSLSIYLLNCRSPSLLGTNPYILKDRTANNLENKNDLQPDM